MYVNRTERYLEIDLRQYLPENHEARDNHIYSAVLNLASANPMVVSKKGDFDITYFENHSGIWSPVKFNGTPDAVQKGSVLDTALNVLMQEAQSIR